MKFFLLLIVLLNVSMVQAQTHIFAQLKGAPINTTGWTLSGNAHVGNITTADNSELVLCANQNNLSGAAFFNEPINLSLCSKWAAEFDTRMYDGDQADGIAFCFLEVPPAGFVTGGGLGIPATAQGLKVCFDTYLNCPSTGTALPKIELRWGTGYDECGSQPTIDNSNGALSVLHSNDYAHVKITYDDGAIQVFVNDQMYLSGFQQFNFAGYLGFTASTGGNTDNHSIKNVVIYTEMPPSEAGTDKTICSGGSVQIGAPGTAGNVYSWYPNQNLDNYGTSNPTFSATNNTGSPVQTRYYVSTAFANNTNCASRDSVTITILPEPSVSVAPTAATICQGAETRFLATVSGGGSDPSIQWKLNGTDVGSDSVGYSASNLQTGDVISSIVTGSGNCPATVSEPYVVTVSPVVVPAVQINASDNNICAETSVTFTASSVNAGAAPVYTWLVNGSVQITTNSTFTTTGLANDNEVKCVLHSSLACITQADVSSGIIVMKVTPLVTPEINILSTASEICKGQPVTFTATVINGGTNPFYQWKKNDTPVGDGTALYTDPNLNNGDVVECTLVSDIRCVSRSMATSNVLKMVVHELPVIPLNHNRELCNNAAFLDAGDFARYQWSTGSTDKKIPVAGSGAFKVTVTSVYGCTGANSTYVQSIIPAPANFLPADSEVCAYSNYLVKPAGNFAAYQWSTNAVTPTLAVHEPGTYWLHVTDRNGCSATDTVVYKEKDCGNEIYFPTAFTPNGDGINDLFKPVFRNRVSQYQFAVYNRWGKLLFYSAEPGRGWDGTLNGTKQNVGVYVWSCTYQFGQQAPKSGRGTIVLIR